MKAVLAAILSLALPALAQTPAQLKQELRTKEAAAKKDPDALYEAGKWASDKGLAAEAKRLYLAVLKIKPDHEGANLGLGNAQFEGKWLPAKEAEALRKKADAAEYAAKGMVEVEGVWVLKEHVADAKQGIFHHDNQLVTKEEKLALLRGMVRHPDTDELIEAKNLEKAQSHYFPIGKEGRWVDEKEADKHHSDIERPWIVRSAYCTIISTLPFAEISKFKPEVDRGYERAARLFGDQPLPPAHRPAVIIAASQDEFRQYGQAFGDGTSSWSAFAMRDEAVIVIPRQGHAKGAVCDGTGGLGPYNIRDAAGIAFAEARAAAVGASLPLWVRHGAGTYASRFENRTVAAFYSKPHIARGGVRNLKAFFAGFDLNGDMSNDDLIHNTFQAGLLLDFAMDGGDPACKAALDGVAEALSKKGDANKAFEKLQAALIAAEKLIVEHLKKLAAS